MGLFSGLKSAARRGIGYDAGVSMADHTLAGAGGAGIGLLNSFDDPENLGGNMAGGAALGVGAMGGRGLIMAVAQQLKRMKPDLPDEMILNEAAELVRAKMANSPTDYITALRQKMKGGG